MLTPSPPPAPAPIRPADPLRGWEKGGLALIALGMLAFGALVVVRSAFQNERKTDFGVYARAAWAVRAGIDPYSVAEERGWHYCYPPLLAVLAVPLAEPPLDHPERAGYLPFAASAAIWYLLSLAALAWTLHALAAVALPNEPRGSRRWWYARTVPFYVALGAVGMTLSRGQVNLFVVALTAAAFAGLAGGRPIRGGAWLTLAASIKVIPALLMAYPLARRQWRAGGGVAAGLLAGLLFVPALGLGWAGAVAGNRSLYELVVKPGTVGGGDQTRAKELTDTVCTDSQSFQAVLHVWRHPDPAMRPRQGDTRGKAGHAAISLVLLLATLFAGRRARPEAAEQLVVFGAFGAVMLLASPVSHMHYYAFALPLAAGLWLREMARRPGLGAFRSPTFLALAAWGVVTLLPLFPWGWAVLMREFGAATAATVGLWALALSGVGRPADARVSAPAPSRGISTMVLRVARRPKAQG